MQGRCGIAPLAQGTRYEVRGTTRSEYSTVDRAYSAKRILKMRVIVQSEEHRGSAFMQLNATFVLNEMGECGLWGVRNRSGRA